MLTLERQLQELQQQQMQQQRTGVEHNCDWARSAFNAPEFAMHGDLEKVGEQHCAWQDQKAWALAGAVVEARKQVQIQEIVQLVEKAVEERQVQIQEKIKIAVGEIVEVAQTLIQNTVGEMRLEGGPGGRV